MRKWYRVQNAEDTPSVVDIHIIDFIGDWIDDYWGFGVTAKAFIKELAALPDSVTTIRVHLNSPGGDVFAALNIANALRDQQTAKGRTVETIVDGLAASAASIVAMAGSTVTMADNALLMIHNPWTVALGDAADLRKTADTLDTVRDTIVATYQWHTDLEADAIVALLDAETWMDADEAIAQGFATDKVEGLRAAASLRPAAVSRLHVPEAYAARVQAWVAPADTDPAPAADPPPAASPPPVDPPASPADVLGRVRAAQLGIDVAEALIAEGASLAQVDARIAAASAEREATARRHTEIRALCQAARLPELADDYLAGAMPLAAIRHQLATMQARLDVVEIDAGLAPASRHGQRAVIDTTAVYAARNRLPATTMKES